MKKVILVRYGEIVLKGLNRKKFEDLLLKHIRSAIAKFGKAKIIKSQARIFIDPEAIDYPYDDAAEKIINIFGVVSVSLANEVETDFEKIKILVLSVVSELQREEKYTTFKVETRRGDKKFPMESTEVSRELGYHILENNGSLKVDLKNPSFTIFVEIREKTYVYGKIIPANGGMPIGANGKAMLLLSGGIDSPVAGWMVAKRGVSIDAIHYHSYPYTSDRAKNKVIELAKILSKYCGNIKLHIVPFTEIQLLIKDKCPEDHITIIMRRIMMKIAERVAKSVNAGALVTGESIGQVASQTIGSLTATNAVVEMPVFRPLIGMDKNEVVERARKIDTFETSILPYEDCCTVFLARHPVTKPKLGKVVSFESVVDFEPLIEQAIKDIEVIHIHG